MSNSHESSSSRDVPALSLWKFIRPSDSLKPEDRDDLLNILLAAARASERPEIRQAVDRAATGHIPTMIALAIEYGERGTPEQSAFELCIGWLLLASPESGHARFAIGWFLARRANLLYRRSRRDGEDEWIRSKIRELDDRAWQWITDAINEYSDIRKLVETIPGGGNFLEHAVDSGSRLFVYATRPPRSSFKPLAVAGPSAAKSGHSQDGAGHTVRVLDAITPAHGDPHLESVTSQFAKLAGPVPTVPPADVDQLTRALLQEFPWADAAIRWIEADLRLSAYVGARSFAVRPIVVTGKPGCGKTRFARRLAELAGVPFGVISAAGSTDNRAMKGTSRGWGNAYPALPLVVIEGAFRANPLILVDEVDKAGNHETNGRLTDALLMLLERETSARWFDECLMARADLSNVNWVLTANDASRLPGPLRSRLSILPFGEPRDEDFESIARGLRQDIARDYGCEPMALPELSPEVMDALKHKFTNSHDVRAMQRLMIAALSAAARNRITH